MQKPALRENWNPVMDLERLGCKRAEVLLGTPGRQPTLPLPASGPSEPLDWMLIFCARGR